MYEAMKTQLGVVTTAAQQAGISRETHYRWLRTDDNYLKWIAEIPELTLDFVENALLKQIRDGNTTSTLFFLKNKGKHRGYVENTNQFNFTKNENNNLIISEKKMQEVVEVLNEYKSRTSK